MARTDKAMRILSTQLELLRGGKVYKKSYCKKNEVSARTFDRDIVEIRMSLSESFSIFFCRFCPIHSNSPLHYLKKSVDMLTPLLLILLYFLSFYVSVHGKFYKISPAVLSDTCFQAV